MKSLLLSGAMSLAFAISVQAQITWAAPTNLSGQQFIMDNYNGTDADISTLGTAVAAVSECNSPATYPITVTDGPLTLASFDQGSDANITGLSSTGTDGSGSTATNYQLALNGCTYQYSGTSFTFNLTGLNANDTYQVQIWNVANDTSRETTYTSTGLNGTTSVNVEHGFVLGTFSGETSQSVTVEATLPAGGIGEVNAVSLRDLGAVPEPSTYAMVFGGLGILVLVSRFRGKLIA